MPTLDHIYFESGLPQRSRRGLTAPAVGGRTAGRSDLESEQLDEFLVWLLARAGLPASQYRGRSLSRRLGACLRDLRVSSTEAARRLLEEQPALVPRALDTVLLGVTEFFRDQPVFTALADVVLPRLAPTRTLRVWSAACSDGHELYSVAMLLDRVGRLGGAELLGTDCRAGAIARARAGRYPAEALRFVAPEEQARCFTMDWAGARVAPRLRDATRWAQQDLLQGTAPGPWDLILWRNMAIYLAPPAGMALWHRIWRELRPGGFLVTGKADHPPRELGWQRVSACIYQKHTA